MSCKIITLPGTGTVLVLVPCIIGSPFPGTGTVLVPTMPVPSILHRLNLSNTITPHSKIYYIITYSTVTILQQKRTHYSCNRDISPLLNIIITIITILQTPKGNN